MKQEIVQNNNLHICVASEGYPSEQYPHFTFVDQLCCQLADLGVKITVIAPQSITQHLVRKTPLNPGYRKKITKQGNEIDIYQPRIITFGNIKLFGKNLSRLQLKCTIEKYFRRLTNRPDVCYGHFWHSAYFLYNPARKYNLPLFVASGEAQIDIQNDFPIAKIKDFIKYVRGIICVSTKNKEESIRLGLATEDKCVVYPNAVDNNLFYLKDKGVLRQKFGYNIDDFIVIFVGSFINRKGVLRVSEAINKLNDDSIKSIFIGGNGVAEEEPNCKGILFSGRVSHEKIVDYLNCADVFVLPTLHEGCSNAIIEAMACGLPVISSDMPFNHDILDNSNSILVNPMDVSQIAESILYLKNNPGIRNRLSKSALAASKQLGIKNRAKKVLEFIEKQINR
jgi:glycosyltransferase involved in cell wall biosynthesis